MALPHLTELSTTVDYQYLKEGIAHLVTMSQLRSVKLSVEGSCSWYQPVVMSRIASILRSLTLGLTCSNPDKWTHDQYLSIGCLVDLKQLHTLCIQDDDPHTDAGSISAPFIKETWPNLVGGIKVVGSRNTSWIIHGMAYLTGTTKISEVTVTRTMPKSLYPFDNWLTRWEGHGTLYPGDTFSIPTTGSTPFHCKLCRHVPLIVQLRAKVSRSVLKAYQTLIGVFKSCVMVRRYTNATFQFEVDVERSSHDVPAAFLPPVLY